MNRVQPLLDFYLFFAIMQIILMESEINSKESILKLVFLDGSCTAFLKTARYEVKDKQEQN